jgi:hypothetical protein
MERAVSTSIHLPLLDRITIASPCTASWDDMRGDDRIRHCAHCKLNVHNLSAMTRDEAEGVLTRLAAGRVCAQFYRRADGTILTQDCPVGLARIRAATRRALVRVAAIVGLVGAAGIAAAATSESTWGDRIRLRALRPFSLVCDWIAPGAPPPPIAIGASMKGDVCIMPPPGPTTPTTPTTPAPPMRPAPHLPVSGGNE